MNVVRPSGYGSENKTGETYAGYGGKVETEPKKTKKRNTQRKKQQKGDIAELHK